MIGRRVLVSLEMIVEPGPKNMQLKNLTLPCNLKYTKRLKTYWTYCWTRLLNKLKFQYSLSTLFNFVTFTGFLCAALCEPTMFGLVLMVFVLIFLVLNLEY